MDVKEAILKRASVRKYKDEPIPREHVIEILDAARLAPTGKNLQPWHFIAITRDEVKKEIGEVLRKRSYEITDEMATLDAEYAAKTEKFWNRFHYMFENAPLMIMVFMHETIPDGYAEQEYLGASRMELNTYFKRSPALMNVGGAMENMNLRAIELGYGMCWMTGPNVGAAEIEKYMKEKHGFNKRGYYLACIASIGIPEGEIKSPKKKELEEITTIIE